MAKAKTKIDNNPKPGESPTLPAPGPCNKCKGTQWFYGWEAKFNRHRVTCSQCGRYIGFLPKDANKTTKQQVAD